MRYCFGYNVEKTLKFNKYHEIHPTSEQNRVLKKTEKPSKYRKSKIIFKMPFTISQ